MRYVVSYRDRAHTLRVCGPFTATTDAESAARRLALRALPGTTTVILLEEPGEHPVPRTSDRDKAALSAPEVRPGTDAPPVPGPSHPLLFRPDGKRATFTELLEGSPVATLGVPYGDTTRVVTSTPCCGRVVRPLAHPATVTCAGCSTRYMTHHSRRRVWWEIAPKETPQP